VSDLSTIAPTTASTEQEVEYREIDRTPQGAVIAASIIAALFVVFVLALCYFYYKYHKDEEDKISAELRNLHSAPENRNLVTSHDGSDHDDAVHVFDINESAKQAQILDGSGDAHLRIPSSLMPLGEGQKPAMPITMTAMTTSPASLPVPSSSSKRRRRDWNRLQTQDELDVKRMLNEREEEERKQNAQRMQLKKESDADQLFQSALTRFAQKNEDTLNKEVLLKIDKNEDPTMSESIAFSHNIDDNENDPQSPFTPFTPQNRLPIGALESESDDVDEKQSMSPLESIKKSVMDLFHSAVAADSKSEKPKFMALESETDSQNHSSHHTYHDSIDYENENEAAEPPPYEAVGPPPIPQAAAVVVDDGERTTEAEPKVNIRQKRKAIQKGGTGTTVGKLQQRNIEVRRRRSMQRMKNNKVVSEKKAKFEQMSSQKQQKTSDIGDYDDRAMLIRPDQLSQDKKQNG